jgi:SRSO17 transposase
MLYIGKVPQELETYLEGAVEMVSRPQKQWLLISTLAMAVAFSRRNVKALSAMLDFDRVRSTFNDFLSKSPWPAPKALQNAALRAVERMDLPPGEEIFLIMDCTQKVKRGEHMEGLSWVREANETQWRKGHRLLLAYLLIRGVMIPLAVDLYLSEKFLSSPTGKALRQRSPDIRFRTTNEMAADILRRIPDELSKRFQITVLLDSGFCNDTVCDAVIAKGFHYVVAAQSTRILVKNAREGRKGRRVVLGEHAPGLVRYQGTNILLPPKSGGGQWRSFRIAEVVGGLRGLGQVKVVVSRRASDGSILCLATSNQGLSAREVVQAYGWRWEIEVTIKGLKGRLGLGQYQCRCYEGMVHHLHLSLLAHLVLTTAELGRRGYTAFNQCAALRLPSIRVLQNRLRRRLWRDILEQLRPKCSDHTIIQRLERALGAA